MTDDYKRLRAALHRIKHIAGMQPTMQPTGPTVKWMLEGFDEIARVAQSALEGTPAVLPAFPGFTGAVEHIGTVAVGLDGSVTYPDGKPVKLMDERCVLELDDAEMEIINALR